MTTNDPCGDQGAGTRGPCREAIQVVLCHARCVIRPGVQHLRGASTAGPAVHPVHEDAMWVDVCALEVEIRLVSELCQIRPEVLIEHRRLRGPLRCTSCCGKSLMESALVGCDVRQHARPEAISKRAPSTTQTSLRAWRSRPGALRRVPSGRSPGRASLAHATPARTDPLAAVRGFNSLAWGGDPANATL
jgi:hypothetical protein